MYLLDIQFTLSMPVSETHFLQLSAMVAFPQLHPWCTAAAASFFTRKEPATLAASSNSQAWPCGLTCTTCWTGSDVLISLSYLSWSFGQRENWTWLQQRFKTPHSQKSHNQLIYINLYFPRICSIVSYHPCPHPISSHKGHLCWGHLPNFSSGLMLGSTLLANLKNAMVYGCKDHQNFNKNPEKKSIWWSTKQLDDFFQILYFFYSPPKKRHPKVPKIIQQWICMAACSLGAEKAALMVMASGDGWGRSCISSDAVAVSLVNEPARVDFLLM